MDGIQLFYLFIYLCQRRWIFARDGSNDADSRKDVPFWGFVDMAHLGGEIPKTPILGRE